MSYSLKEYNLGENNLSIKENNVVKITYLENIVFNESFWVWVEKVNKEGEITGIITNSLLNNKLKIGQKINFNKKNIKEIADKTVTYNEIIDKIKETKKKEYFEYLRTLANINI